MRAHIIRAVTFFGGLYFFLKFVLPEKIAGFEFGAFHEQISDGFVLVGAMALALGLINLLVVHGSRVVFKRTGWVASSALLLGLMGMVVVTTLDWIATNRISREAEKISILKDFSDRIVADAAAGVIPQVRGRELTPEIRNRYLLEAFDAALAELRRTQEMLAEQKPGVLESPPRRLFDRSVKESIEQEEMALGLSVALDVEADGIFNKEPNEKFSEALGALAVAYRGVLSAMYSQSLVKHFYDLLFEGIFISLGAAMFSLLGFYIAAAAYRAFRVKSMESALMMTAALLVMLGQIPFGLWLWEGFPEVRLWLLRVPSAAAARAIEMGASLAGLVMAFRMWLSIESESFE